MGMNGKLVPERPPVGKCLHGVPDPAWCFYCNIEDLVGEVKRLEKEGFIEAAEEPYMVDPEEDLGEPDPEVDDYLYSIMQTSLYYQPIGKRRENS